MSDETQTPSDDPQTSEEEEALRELSSVPGADAARISPDLARRMVTEWDRDELRKLTQSLIGRDIFTENEGDPVYFMVDRKGTLVAEKSDFRVERVGPGTPEMAECKRVVVETTHYLHSWPSACEVFRLVPTGSNWATHRKDGTPIIYGVALYGYGAGATVQSTVCGSPDAKGKDGEDYAAHVYELTRLWVAERMAQNCTGMLLSESLGQQSRPIIVTYADSEQHDGTVYKAVGMLYTGLTNNGKTRQRWMPEQFCEQITINGQRRWVGKVKPDGNGRFHHRTFDRTKTRAQMEAQYGSLVPTLETPKHRYVWFRYARRDKKTGKPFWTDWNKAGNPIRVGSPPILRWKVQPYPKATEEPTSKARPAPSEPVEPFEATPGSKPSASTFAAEAQAAGLPFTSLKEANEAAARCIAQWQREKEGVPPGYALTAASDEPVGEQPMDASNKLPAAMEPLAGAGGGNGPHVPEPTLKVDTYKGSQRIDAPPHGGISGARRATIGAHPREGINGDGSEPKSVRLSSVQSEEVRWLWTGRVPLGKIVLLDGDPDVGKTFITHDLTARVTTGTPMPLEDTPADPAGVVILSAEDGLADTIRPRIQAAGGDLDRIECFALGTLPFIPDDLTAIEEAVTRVQARLIVVDPLIAFLKVSATNDQRVRQAMTPLADLAQRLGVAVIGIRHLTKNDRQKLAKYRGSGSIGLLGAARAAFLAAPHPTDPTCYVLARSKGNLCAQPPAVTYKIDPSLRVEWLGEVEITADELLAHPTPAPAPRLEEAINFLRDALGEGPRDATDVTSEAIAKGITAKTLRDAREALGVVVKRMGFGPSSKFVWSLPPTESTSDDAEE